MKQLNFLARLFSLFGTSRELQIKRELPTRAKQKEVEKQNLVSWYERNGVKKWVIEGVEIWARDIKNAQRKFKNLQTK